ncbi:MAG: alpha/beta fold hydrolase [Thermodesulfobacteriota bacterium]
MKQVAASFKSHGDRCAAVLYLPDKVRKPPVVVMAHGFGAESDLRLPDYAERFVKRGLAVFLFDYRTFGQSEGSPRKWVSPRRHLADWQEAIAHVRTRKDVDASRMGLWGTSFSGGHALVTAARVKGVSAVVAQVPFVDGLASTLQFDLRYQMEAVGHGLKDIFRMATLQPAYRVPIVSPPDRFGVLNTPESEPGFKVLLPPGYQFDNSCPARVLLNVPLYRPISHAKKIPCPVLLLYGEKDTLIPAKSVEKTGKRIKNCTLVPLPVGHFEPYLGEMFEKTVKMEADFLVKNL